MRIIHNFLISGLTAILLFSSSSMAEMQVSEAFRFGSEGIENDQFQLPCGIAVHPETGDIYVSDTGNNAVKRFSSGMDFIAAFGATGSGTAQFHAPHGMAFSSDGNTLYVVNTGNSRIQKLTVGEELSFDRWWGSEGHETGEFYFPRDVAVDASGFVYVLDAGNARVQKFSANGVFQTTLAESALLNNPSGLDVDEVGNLYIADRENSRLVKCDNSGQVTLVLEGRGLKEGEFLMPRDVAVDEEGSLFVADYGRVQKFDATGRFLYEFGSFALDFLSPQALDFTPEGNLVVVDSDKHQVQVYKVKAVVGAFSSLLSAFSPNGDGSDDTLAIRFVLNEPAKITMKVYDESGDLVRILLDDIEDETIHALRLNEVVWDGKDDQNAFVPAGTYEIRLSAVDVYNNESPLQVIYVTIKYPVEDPQIQNT